MESLAPPLEVLLQLRLNMENGASFRESLRRLLRERQQDDFVVFLAEWVVRKSHARPTKTMISRLGSSHRRALVDLFERGWDGEPILEPLQELESEIRDASMLELDQFIAALPFRAMLPVLLLQFPAYLLLLLGPLLLDLIHSFGSPI